MGTVLAVIYAADTIVAFKYYRDSTFDWLLSYSTSKGKRVLSQHHKNYCNMEKYH